MQIEIRRGQFWKSNATAHRKVAAGKFAAELLERERVASKVKPRFKISQRGKSHVIGARHVHRHIAGAAQNRLPERSADVDVQRQIAIQFLNCRHQSVHKIHRASRQTNFCRDRRFVRQLPLPHDLCDVKWQIRRQLDRLNLGLLQFARNDQLIVLRLRT